MKNEIHIYYYTFNSIWVQPKHFRPLLLAKIMDIYLFLYIFVILIFKTLADEFCQQNIDGVEECEENINKDPEVLFSNRALFK